MDSLGETRGAADDSAAAVWAEQTVFKVYYRGEQEAFSEERVLVAQVQLDLEPRPYVLTATALPMAASQLRIDFVDRPLTFRLHELTVRTEADTLYAWDGGHALFARSVDVVTKAGLNRSLIVICESAAAAVLIDLPASSDAFTLEIVASAYIPPTALAAELARHDASVAPDGDAVRNLVDRLRRERLELIAALKQGSVAAVALQAAIDMESLTDKHEAALEIAAARRTLEQGLQQINRIETSVVGLLDAAERRLSDGVNLLHGLRQSEVLTALDDLAARQRATERLLEQIVAAGAPAAPH